MRKFYYFLTISFLFLSITLSFAETIDELKLKFTESTPENRAEIAYKIAKRAVTTDLVTFNKYIQEAEKYAQEFKQKDFLLLINLLQAFSLDYQGLESEKFFTQAENLISEDTDSLFVTTVYQSAHKFMVSSKFDEAVKWNKIAFKYANLSVPGLRYDVQTLFGSINFYQELYEEALVEYLKAKEIAYKSDNPEQIAGNLVNIGNVYTYTNEVDKGLENYLEALNLLKDSNNRKFYSNALQNTAAIYVQKEEFDKALQFHLQAFSIYDEENLDREKAISLCNIANLYNRMDQYDKSVENYKKAVSINEKINNLTSLNYCYLGLAETYLHQAKYKQSLEYIKKTEELTHKLGSTRFMKFVHQAYHEYYNAIKDYEKAYQAYKKYDAYEDSLNEKKNSQLLKELQTKYEVEKKQHKIQVLEKNQKIYQHNVHLFILVTLFLISTITFLLYRAKERARANEKINSQQKQLELVNQDQKKLLEELSELNNTKNKFISILAHDMKNGFTALLKGSQMLSDKIDQLDKKTITVIAKEMNISALTMFDILENLLAWARVQNGRIKINFSVVRLNPIVSKIVQVFQHTAEEKEITFRIDVAENHTFYADRTMISSVIENLIHNAIKFSNAGGFIDISSKKEQNVTVLSIKDYGTGISLEDQKKLFKLDGHYHKKGTKGEKGSGLGLLVCKEFIEKNNGSINIQSEPGKGSEFTVKLPCNET